MQIKTTDNGNGRTVSIQTDERLDWKVHGIFSQVTILANSPWIENIEIDLRQTRIIRDSGLSLLSVLCMKSGLSRNHIGVVNCRPELRAQLLNSKLAGYLRVLSTC